MVAEGQYANDQRVGVWTFYAKRKRMVQKYDYTTKRVLHYDVAREKLLNKGFELIIPDEFPSTNGNQRPVFIGGVEYLKTVLMTNVDLSKEQWSAFKYTDPLYVSLTISAAAQVFRHRLGPARLWRYNDRVSETRRAKCTSTF